MSTGKMISDEELLEHFRNTKEPFLTAPEVAESFPISRQGIDKRLKKLHREGKLRRKKTGQTTIWWLPGQSLE